MVEATSEPLEGTPVGELAPVHGRTHNKSIIIIWASTTNTIRQRKDKDLLHKRAKNMLGEGDHFALDLKNSIPSLEEYTCLREHPRVWWTGVGRGTDGKSRPDLQSRERRKHWAWLCQTRQSSVAESLSATASFYTQHIFSRKWHSSFHHSSIMAT